MRVNQILVDVAEIAADQSHFVDWMVVLSTIALAVISLALTWVTYLVYRQSKDEHKVSVSALSHDNDNMYDIAKSQMDFHHKHQLAIRQLNRIKYSRRKKTD